MSIRQLLSLTMMRMGGLRPFQAVFDIGDRSAQQLRRLAQRDQPLGQRPIAKSLEALCPFHGPATGSRAQFALAVIEDHGRGDAFDRAAVAGPFSAEFPAGESTHLGWRERARLFSCGLRA